VTAKYTFSLDFGNLFLITKAKANYIKKTFRLNEHHMDSKGDELRFLKIKGNI